MWGVSLHVVCLVCGYVFDVNVNFILIICLEYIVFHFFALIFKKYTK